MAKIKFKPKSNLGKWSIGLIIVMLILFCLAPLGELWFMGGFYLGIAAFLCGITSIVRKKDYSVWVFICTLIGLFILLSYLKIELFPTWRIIDMR